MKKFLKRKYEEETKEMECLKKTNHNPDQEFQPPLPPYPPPPDSPIINIKTEFIDDKENEENITVETPDLNRQEVRTDIIKSEEIEEIMCRNFIRGQCYKGSACLNAHRIILSQLDKVYTFCKNFQNRGCSLTNCKFVHATVFEKESFLRTGQLPPHTLSHLKRGHPNPVMINHQYFSSFTMSMSAVCICRECVSVPPPVPGSNAPQIAPVHLPQGASAFEITAATAHLFPGADNRQSAAPAYPYPPPHRISGAHQTAAQAPWFSGADVRRPPLPPHYVSGAAAPTHGFPNVAGARRAAAPPFNLGARAPLAPH